MIPPSIDFTKILWFWFLFLFFLTDFSNICVGCLVSTLFLNISYLRGKHVLMNRFMIVANSMRWTSSTSFHMRTGDKCYCLMLISQHLSFSRHFQHAHIHYIFSLYTRQYEIFTIFFSSFFVWVSRRTTLQDKQHLQPSHGCHHIWLYMTIAPISNIEDPY